MTTGQRIKMLRERDNITQVELAERINETKQTIYKYENDIVTDIPKRKIEAIAAIFDVRPAYLLGWDDDRKSYTIEEFIERTLSEEEMILLRGYRAASEERKSDMLDLARKALKKEETDKLSGSRARNISA